MAKAPKTPQKQYAVIDTSCSEIYHTLDDAMAGLKDIAKNKDDYELEDFYLVELIGRMSPGEPKWTSV